MHIASDDVSQVEGAGDELQRGGSTRGGHTGSRDRVPHYVCRCHLQRQDADLRSNQSEWSVPTLWPNCRGEWCPDHSSLTL